MDTVAVGDEDSPVGECLSLFFFFFFLDSFLSFFLSRRTSSSSSSGVVDKSLLRLRFLCFFLSCLGSAIDADSMVLPLCGRSYFKCIMEMV